MHGRRMLLGALGAVSVGVLAVASSAVAAPSIAMAPNFAAYTGSETATSVSATVTVPTIECSGVSGKKYAGQSIGVHLYSAGLQVTSDVRTYCHGSTAVYSVELANPVAGVEVFTPASMTIHPGDRVQLKVQTSGHGTSASATMNSGGQSQGTASEGPDPLPDAIPYMVMTTVAAGGNGAPIRSGTPPAGNPAIAGPVPSTRVKFTAAKVNRLPLSQVNLLQAVQWVDSGNHPLVTPSALDGAGTAFSFKITA